MFYATGFTDSSQKLCFEEPSGFRRPALANREKGGQTPASELSL